MSQTITIELSDELVNRAQELEINYKDFFWEGVKVISQMDKTVLYRLVSISKGLDIPLYLVIQNLLISEWARKAASREVIHPGQLLPEFAKEVLDDGTKNLITGEQLFNNLFSIYKEELMTPEQTAEADSRMAKLNKYKLPSEQAVTYEELSRRQKVAEIAQLPPKVQAAERKAEERQRAWQKERHKKYIK